MTEVTVLGLGLHAAGEEQHDFLQATGDLAVVVERLVVSVPVAGTDEDDLLGQVAELFVRVVLGPHDLVD